MSAMRHPCTRSKPAPKGDGHVDVDPAVLPRCNPRIPSAGDYSHEETDRSQETGRIITEQAIVVPDHSCTQHLGYE